MKSIGKRLRALRKKRGLSMQALAQKVCARGGKITHAAIGEVEREANAGFRAQNLQAIAEVLQVNPSWLIHGSGHVSRDFEIFGRQVMLCRKNKSWSLGDLVRQLNAAAGGEFVSIAQLNLIEFGSAFEISPEPRFYAQVLGVSEDFLRGKNLKATLGTDINAISFFEKFQHCPPDAQKSIMAILNAFS